MGLVLVDFISIASVVAVCEDTVVEFIIDPVVTPADKIDEMSEVSVEDSAAINMLLAITLPNVVFATKVVALVKIADVSVVSIAVVSADNVV